MIGHVQLMQLIPYAHNFGLDNFSPGTTNDEKIQFTKFHAQGLGQSAVRFFR